MDSESQLRAAAEITEEAGRILLTYFGSNRVSARSKGPRDLVTAADIAAEKHVVNRLRRGFPGDGLVAEEGSAVDATSDRRWYLDPLDGTMNYSRGIPMWCVSLALMVADRPVLGVVHDPLRRETFAGACGLPPSCNGVSLSSSRVEDLSDAFVHLTVDFNDQSMLEGLEDVRTIAPHVLRTRNIGSAALALAYVAAGRFDAMLHRSAHSWDYAAGVALIQAIGGCVTDMQGNPFTPETVSLIAAANAPLHARLLALVQSSGTARIE